MKDGVHIKILKRKSQIGISIREIYINLILLGVIRTHIQKLVRVVVTEFGGSKDQFVTLARGRSYIDK